LNLNPYAVLQVPLAATDDEIKKAYRTLSRYVHPDKNLDDRQRAQEAFEAVNKAYKMLTEPDVLEKCKQVVAIAKGRVEEQFQKDKGKTDAPIDKVKFEKDLQTETYKLFAEVEKRRVQLEERDASERKRKREQEIDLEQKRKNIKEKEETWEKGREDRVNSWRSFATTKGKKAVGELKPPKLKQTK
jgi:DnaJ family protein C protein 8